MLDIRNVALAAWLLSWLGPLSAYLLSAAGGYVDWCIPHLTGCDSVSATGRHGWGYFAFKATMLPAAGFTFVYWVLCRRWLTLITTPARTDTVIFWLGTIGTAFLVLYVTFLGSDGDTYRALRRYGTVVYFGFTYLAQLLFAKRIVDSGLKSPLVTCKYGLVFFILATGLIFAAAANFFADDDFLQNISEWNCATALTAFPGLTWLLWRKTGFHVRYEIVTSTER
jgi:hypothetical protein